MGENVKVKKKKNFISHLNICVYDSTFIMQLQYVVYMYVCMHGIEVIMQ